MRPEVIAIEEDCDTTSEQLLSEWQSLGVGNREVRSHRAPRHWRGSHVVLGFTALAATAVLTVGYASSLRREDHIASTATRGGNGIISDGNPLGLPSGDIVATTPVPFATESLENVQRTARASAATRSSRPTSVKATTRWVTPVAKVDITSCFGPRNGGTHKGIDFSAKTGTPIRAVGPGRVVQAGWRFSGLGYSVVIDHGGGQMSLYGHASRVLVRTNQQVSAGSTIALVGSTGASTGPHVHLGFSRTSNINSLFPRLTNPAPWLRIRGAVPGRCR